MARFDPEAYLPLTPAMFQVLVALADGEKHGYAIGKEVARRTDGQVQLRAATLYTVIKRFLADGLIEESTARPDPSLDDERRRYYRLSERGRRVAEAEATRLEATLRQARAKLKPGRRILPITGFLLVTALLGSARAEGWAPTRAPVTPAVRYTIAISDVRARTLSVTADVESAVGALAMDQIQADHLPEGWGTFVEDLRATDRSGRALALSPRGAAQWMVSSRGPFRLTYRVNLRFVDEPWPSGNEQAGIRTDNALYLVTRPLFVAPAEAGMMAVRFDVPDGWRVSSPWSLADGTGRAFVATDRHDLQRNLVVVGRHAEASITAGSLTLLLALPGRTADAASLVAPAFERIARHYTQLFPRTPSGRYLMAVAYAAQDDGEAFSRGGGFTVSDDITPETVLVWGNALAHELLHFWNGQQLRGGGARESWAWFREGATEYLANVVLHRTGLIDDAGLMRKVDHHVGNYLYFTTSPVFPRMTLQEAGRQPGRHRFGVYDGGWMAALCLDGLIREGSSDRATFDDLMRRLYEGFALNGREYTVADLAIVSSELAGRPLQPFFDAHVSGAAPLPVRDCLRRVGLAGAFQSYAADAFVRRSVPSPSRVKWPARPR